MLLTLAGLTAAAALEGEQVGVISVAPQAEVGPPDGVPLARVEDELRLRELHGARTEFVPLIIYIGHLSITTQPFRQAHVIGGGLAWLII